MVDDGSDASPGHDPESPIGPASFHTVHDGRVVIHIGGELDAQSGGELTTLLTQAFEGSPDAVVVDLTELDFVDSIGLSVLVIAHHQGRAEGIPFEVHNVSPSCMRVFEITRLVDVLDLR